MKQLYLFLIGLFISSFATSQTSTKPTIKNESIFYFYTIHYGYHNDVYISDIYELDIDRNDVFKKTKDRFDDVKKHIIVNGIAKEIQSGYEKNYFKKDQAQNERDYLMSQFKNQDFKVITFKYK